MNLDEKLNELKKIAELLENENTTFDEGIKLYEKGAELAKECMKYLNETKGKITQIKQDLETFKEEDLK